MAAAVDGELKRPRVAGLSKTGRAAGDGIFWRLAVELCEPIFSSSSRVQALSHNSTIKYLQGRHLKKIPLTTSDGCG
jgi:hypothetical protein